MKALIDADIFQYEFGSAVDEDGRPLPWPFVQSRVQARIDGILEATQADEYQLYLTSDDKSNFRYKIATIKPYKGHRKEEKPHYYYNIREFLIKHRGAIEIFNMEADDALSIEQYKNNETWNFLHDYEKDEDYYCRTIICSRDKDLDMVPGWHYRWGADSKTKSGMYFISELEGLHNFYCQLLTGDPVDNILGLFGVGIRSTLLDRIRLCTDENAMYSLVKEEYEKRFGAYWEMFLTENARLLWMLRTKDDMWKIPNVA